MKTFNRFVLVILTIGITTLISCKKEDQKEDQKEDPIVTETYKSQISAKIGSNTFTATTKTGLLSNEIFKIQGVNASGQLKIEFTDRTTLGYHTLENNGQESINWLVNSNLTYRSESGTILITEHDRINKIIKGTFNATLHNQTNESEKLQITNGVLDIKYTVQ